MRLGMPANSTIASFKRLRSVELILVLARPVDAEGRLLKFPRRLLRLNRMMGVTTLLPKKPRLSLWMYMRKLMPVRMVCDPFTQLTLSMNWGAVTARAVCGERQFGISMFTNEPSTHWSDQMGTLVGSGK